MNGFITKKELNRGGRNYLLVQRTSDSKFAIMKASWLEPSGLEHTEGTELLIPVSNTKALRIDGLDWVSTEEQAK